MKLAVSNIAWPAEERDAAYALLSERGIGGLEIAPGLFSNRSADVFEPTTAEAAEAVTAVQLAGLNLVSMQSLLFGVKRAALFEGEAALANLEIALLRAIRLAERFHIPNLVFGSPGQRVIPPEMSMAEAQDIAIAFFRRMGGAAAKAGCTLAIEPNPAAYGTNFLNDVNSALVFVKAVNHPAVTLNLDIGAMHMNGDFDEIETVVAAGIEYISHVHFSEPHLGPAPARKDQVARVMTAMRMHGYDGYYSIEMKATAVDPLGVLAQGIDTLLAAEAGLVR